MRCYQMNYELDTLKETLDIFSLKDFRKSCGQKFKLKKKDSSKLFFELKKRGAIKGTRNRGFYFW